MGVTDRLVICTWREKASTFLLLSLLNCLFDWPEINHRNWHNDLSNTDLWIATSKLPPPSQYAHTHLASSVGFVPGRSNGTAGHSIVHCVQPCHMTLAVTARGGAMVSLTGLNKGEGDALTALLTWSVQWGALSNRSSGGGGLCVCVGGGGWYVCVCVCKSVCAPWVYAHL